MNHNSNAIIQSFWVGPRLGPMEVLCIHSYLENGHDFHLYTYEEVQNVPKGTIIKDANKIIRRNEIYVDAFGGYVNLSNQFRYTLLYKIGGWWVDMDTVCLKPFDFEEEYIFSSETSDPYKRYLVNTTYIKSQPGAKFLKDCLDFLNARGHENIHWGELGVNLISRMIFRNGLGKYVKPPVYFCPVSPYHVKGLISNTNYALPDAAYALHWWNEIWRRMGLDKNNSFPVNSIYEKMKREFKVPSNET